jgi:hypothetical protein
LEQSSLPCSHGPSFKQQPKTIQKIQAKIFEVPDIQSRHLRMVAELVAWASRRPQDWLKCRRYVVGLRGLDSFDPERQKLLNKTDGGNGHLSCHIEKTEVIGWSVYRT